jgi:peptide/nickel transport system permease protein
LWLNRVSPIGKKQVGVGWPKSTTVGVKMPDLGRSFAKGRPVGELIGEALPITLLLNALSIPLIYSLSILAGIRAARHRGGLFDVGTGTFMLALWSIPSIWMGVMLVGFLASRQYVQWFPTTGLHGLRADSMPFLPAFTPDGWERGWLLDMLWHLCLPVFCLSYGGFAFLTKLSRGSVLEAIAADYVRTARAKGVDEKGVLYRHVFANSLIPLITVAAYVLPGLLGGSIVVETIFGVPGMGHLMVEAAQLRDRELVLSEALIGGFLGLISYLLADIGYALADPRVTYD